MQKPARLEVEGEREEGAYTGWREFANVRGVRAGKN